MAKDLVIVGINDGIFHEKLASFVREKAITYPILLAKKLMQAYYTFSKGKLLGWPYYVLLNKKGEIVENDIHYSQVKALIERNSQH